VKGDVVHRVHRRDHVRLRVRLADGHEVDAVAGVLDVADTVTLALDPDGVALVSRRG
jgi:thiamine transport system ATP-binding protein